MKPIKLTNEELVMQQDFLNDGGHSAREAIRAYVESNEPIPNELKSILFDILDQDFKGKSKSKTAAFWHLIIKEVIFKIKGIYISENGDVVLDETMAMKRVDAIAQVAEEHFLDQDTVERNYKSGKYRRIKDAFGGGVK
jgi:hypothetical protein